MHTKRRWYKRKRWILFLACLSSLTFVTVALLFYGALLFLQPLGNPGRYAAELEAVLLSTDTSGENAREHLARAAELAAPIHERLTDELRAVPSAFSYEGLYFNAEPQDHEPALFAANDRLCRQALDEFAAVGVWSALERASMSKRSEPTLDHTNWLLTQSADRLKTVRMLARANQHRAQLALKHADVAAFLSTVREGLAIGRSLTPDVDLSAELTACLADDQHLQLVRTSLTSQHFDESALSELQSIILQSERRTLQASVAADGILALDIIEMVYSDNGQGSGYLRTGGFRRPTIAAAQGGIASWLDLVPAVWLPSKRDVVDATWRHREATLMALENEWSVSRIMEMYSTTLDTAISQSNYALANLGAPSGTAIVSSRRSETQRRGTLLMIALQRYRLQHERYPSTLNELVPQFLISLPRDPFSDAPYGYRLLDPTAARADTGYVLYSFGLDDTDNSGTPHEKPYKSFHEDGQGTDFIINR